MKRIYKTTCILSLSLLTVLCPHLPLVPLLGSEAISIQPYEKNSVDITEKKDTAVANIQQLSMTFRRIAKETIPAVVYLKTERDRHNSEDIDSDIFQDDLFRRFFAPHFKAPQKQQISGGSGFIISSDGYIMTNYHVIKDATKIVVGLQDEEKRELPAVFIGKDAHTDVAIIKIDAKDLPYLSLGNSDNAQIGDWVMAIGNPFQFDATVTAGIISAKGRQNLHIIDLEDFIQTDAAMNPGSSGGPLLDLNGSVIGMNTAIFSLSGYYMGVGFAIPSNILKAITTQLIETGSVARGFLGISLQPMNKELAKAFGLEKEEGVVITEVMKGSPAEKAGLQQGDIVLKVNDQRIQSAYSFKNLIRLMVPEQTITVSLQRKNEVMNISVVLGNADIHNPSSKIFKKLGIEVETLSAELAKRYGYSPDAEGVMIKSVYPKTISSFVGIPEKALIVEINHRKIRNMEDFTTAMDAALNDSSQRILLLLNNKGCRQYCAFNLPK